METAKYHQLRWEDVNENDTLPRVTIEVPYKRVIMTPAATWDYMPGHHEPDYARSQGQKTIYLNTLFFQGLIDRVITEWAGPGTFIARRKLAMKSSIYAGDTAYGQGRVTRVYQDDQGRCKVDVDVVISNQNGVSATADATVILPNAK